MDFDLDRNWAHLCIDMQSIFAEETDWHAPWLKRVLPAVEALAERAPERTVFTRFIPPETPQEAPGAWRHYYERWENMTRSRQPASMFDLVPTLARLVPPARVFDKPIYSPWLSGNLHGFFQSAGISTLIITGGESDVCVLGAVMGAIDLGYRVVVAEDAIFGSADETHEAILAIYRSRFQIQLTTSSVQELLDLWKRQGL